MSTHAEHHEQDPIEREEFFEIEQPDDGFARARLFAFNTFVALDVYGDNAVCRDALSAARDACRAYERLFSRTLPHSDIARVNDARGEATEVDPRTFDLLERALHYCSESEGVFDVTIGPLVRLWDFKRGVVADEDALAEAAPHVDWRGVELFREGGSCFVRMRDPLAALDAGGIAKGWIADELSDLLADCGLSGSIVNLGGNVMVRGEKPTGEAWRVGIRDPKNPGSLLGAVSLREGSAVTSGTYERSFRKDGALYHHVLDPRTGMPVDTDVAGVTVVARRSIDAEGFSTTLLALGMERSSPSHASMTRSSRRSSSTPTAPSPAPAKRRRSLSEPARSIGRGKSARGRNEREGETEDAARRAGAPGRRRGARLDTAAMPPPSTRRRSDADFRNSKKYPLTNRPRTFKIFTCASC